MRRVGMIGILLTALIVISGCGGSGGGTQVSCSTDNSGNQENEFGYYGGDTKVCKNLASEEWIVKNAEGNDINTLNLYTDGRYTIEGELWSIGKYGVSKDGKTIKFEYIDEIVINSVDVYTDADGGEVYMYNIGNGEKIYSTGRKNQTLLE